MRLVRALLVIVVALHFIAPSALADSPKQTKRILLIHAFEPFMPYSITVNQSIRSTIESDKTIHADLYTEYLDLTRFPDEDYRKRLLDLLRYKYSRRSPDLIFVMLQPALDFFLKDIEGLFPEVPVVFCSIEKYQIEGRALRPNITGVLMGIDPKGTLDAALGLRPDTRKVIVIGGSSDNDRGYEAAVRTALKEYEGRLDITYMTGMPIEKVLKTVPDLQAHTIILYITMFQDSTGRSFVPKDVVTLISRISNVPVFAMFDSYFGSGIVGGRLVSFEEQGKKAAEMGLRILHGAKPADFSISANPDAYMFDWRQMKRWGMSEKNLPPHSVVGYKTMTLWDQYRWLIIGIVVFCAIESLLIFILLMQRMMRRKAEAALQKSEEKYRSIFENAVEGIYQTTPEGHFISANPALAKMLGYETPEEMTNHIVDIGKQVYVNPEARAKFGQILEEHGIVEGFEMRLHRKDGGNIRAVTNARAVRDGAGKVLHYEGTMEDVTDRKRTEDELRSAHERLYDIIEFLPDATFVIDREKRVVAWNKAIEEMTGIEKEAMLGKGDYAYSVHFYGEPRPIVIDLVFEKNEEMEKTYDNVKREGSKLSMEVYVPRAYRGRGAYLSATASPLFDREGNVAGAIESIRDTTEQKRIEKALQESEERYRTAIESSNDGVAMVRDQNYIFVNRKFLEIFGFQSPDEVVGQSIGRLVHPDDRDRILEMGERQQQKEDVPDRYEFKGLMKNGDIVYIEASVTAATYQGEPISLAFMRDVTERKSLQAQLLQARKMEAIGTFAGGVAHDFNNILTVITGFGTLIKMAADKHEPINGEYLDQILASSQKAANLTQSLLAFGRKQRINLAPHSIDEMVANTGKLLERLLTEDIDLKITPATEELIVMADVTQIDQILINLAVNARDAMPNGGLLSIRTEVTELDDEFIKAHGYGEKGKYALLSISDTGIGMDRPTKERIFEPFFTTKEVGKGTGLGLATVYGIVKQHNGHISVYSEPHQGTTFRLYFPLVNEERKDETRPSEKVKGGAETVLVVEDDVGVRRLTTEILRAHGYTTVEATDGEDAVKVFMENRDKVDLMVMDVVMPKKNGKEAYEEIKRTHPNVRVIFTSGYTGDVILDKGIQGEAVDFIAKPLSPNGLLQKVREVLDR